MAGCHETRGLAGRFGLGDVARLVFGTLKLDFLVTGVRVGALFSWFGLSSVVLLSVGLSQGIRASTEAPGKWNPFGTNARWNSNSLYPVF